MRGDNLVILLGNIGQDPDIKYTPNGTVIARLSLATTRGRKNRDGEWEDETTWHRVLFYGKLAETVQKYVKKGDPLYVKGRLDNRSWDDDKGQKHYITEVIGHELQLLGKKKEGTERMDPMEPSREDDLPF
ncbi:MAG: single-stranded DNA-binding protein [Sphaerochaeta sp.]|jgi:single-strand DNA-binding protein|nr:single-stranded DNA-binding protein [Sphaerochaeta sp.]